MSQMGWECPVCGAGNAPSVKRCPCTPEVKVETVPIELVPAASPALPPPSAIPLPPGPTVVPMMPQPYRNPYQPTWPPQIGPWWGFPQVWC